MKKIFIITIILFNGMLAFTQVPVHQKKTPPARDTLRTAEKRFVLADGGYVGTESTLTSAQNRSNAKKKPRHLKADITARRFPFQQGTGVGAGPKSGESITKAQPNYKLKTDTVINKRFVLQEGKHVGAGPARNGKKN